MTTLSFTFDETRKLARLVIDSGAPVNTIDKEMMRSFEQVLGKLRDCPAEGVIVKSNKRGSFITGADLAELFSGGVDGIEADLRRLGRLYAALSSVKAPVVAVLSDQAAVGGGFEFLLRCCDHIFATPRSSFGFPEVHLGLVPAAGGIYYLERIAGLEGALNAVTRGRNARSEELAPTKLVTPCKMEELEEKAAAWIGEHKEKSRRVTSPDEIAVAPAEAPARARIIDSYRKRAESSPHRPWLLSAVNLFEEGLGTPFDGFIERNIEEFCELCGHPNTKNKIDFFLLKSFTFPKMVHVDPKQAVRCETVGIVGGGLMGRGIAQVAAEGGIKVRIMDVSEDVARASVETIRRSLEGLVKKGRWPEKRMQACMANIEIAGSLESLKDVPLIIEAIPEKLEMKQKLVGEVHRLGEDIIFATNTSSLPIGDISKGTARPDRVVGMHFFSPVPLMELLEVIEGKESSKQSVATAMVLGRAMGKTCILVGDGPGFYTSRVFSGFLYGGFHRIEAGADPWDVDRVAVRAGFPRGPIHMFCSVGGMIPYHAGKFMETRAPERLPVPASMARAAEAGYVGAGGQKGFYKDEAGTVPDETVLDHLARKEGVPVPAADEIEDILLLGMVNEAFWVLGEGILRDFASMDIGAVLGVGFPDCFHGPARYAGMRGLSKVVARLEELREKFKIPHLGPAPELRRLAACGVEGNLI